MAVDLGRALAAAAQRLGRDEVRVVGEPLAGSTRSVVVRADGYPPVVVKVFDTERGDEGWPRESAALSVLNGRSLPVPALVAAVAEPPLIVTADLGRGPSLADRLLGDDPAAAKAALRSWAGSLGRVHAGSLDAGPAFAAALPPGLAADSTPAMVADGMDRLGRTLPRVGLSLSDEAASAVRVLADGVGGPLPLSPDDPCPDNNIETPDGLVLLDFESATVRSVAWDLAYLVVPWPSCWCAWRLPGDWAEDALAEWRAASALAVSTMDIAKAVIAWAFITTGWFLARAIDGETLIGGDDSPSPRRRALLLHRLGLVTGAVKTSVAPVSDLVEPALRDFATRLRANLVHAWGDLELPLPPALR